MQEFDAPMFKILAANDTGDAVGHQGGVVIPKDLDPYFPQLSRQTSAEQPAVDEYIIAQLFVGGAYVGTVETRYQFQTWGGTRSPERRLTGSLGPIRNLAVGGDILLIERSITDEKLYRLSLLKQGTPEFQSVLKTLDGRRWGPLDDSQVPVREVDVEQASQEIQDREIGTFEMFDSSAPVLEVRTRKVARSRAFQSRLLPLYKKRCAACQGGLMHPDGKSELEAAHIVPRNLKGADDARNGMLLCRAHHWAYDHGLFGVLPDYKIIVPLSVLRMERNSGLEGLNGQAIFLPSEVEVRPHIDALDWHLTNRLVV